MSDELKDGGPAFPGKLRLVHAKPGSGERYVIVNDGEPGMSLRDHFAGMAMMAFTPPPYFKDNEDLAKQCYEVADAFLKAREVKQ